MPHRIRHNSAEANLAKHDAAAHTPASDAPEETVLHEAYEDEAEDRVTALIDADAPADAIARGVEEQEPADAADTLEDLEPADSVEVLHEMDEDAAAGALAHMQPDCAVGFLAGEPPAQIAVYLRRMDTDDATDLLQNLPKGIADETLRALPRSLAATLGKLARYDPETAGGLMKTDFVRLKAGMTVTEAVECVRRDAADRELFYLYCTGAGGELAGVVNLRSLVLADPGQRIEEIMGRDVDVLRTHLDREEVANAFDRYDFVALPVVDEGNRLLGVVDIDDIVDTIRAEHTEDALKQVGAGPSEGIHARVGVKLRSRLPWLAVNLLAAGSAVVVVGVFDTLFETLRFLAVLMPVIANQAGNAGSQSMAVTLRGIVLGEVRRDRVSALLIRETCFGLVAGVGIGLLAAACVTALGVAGVAGAGWRVGTVAGIAMAGALTVSCMIGAGIPILLDRFKVDPATASSIFLLWLTDMLSFTAFLGLAWFAQEWLLNA